MEEKRHLPSMLIVHSIQDKDFIDKISIYLRSFNAERQLEKIHYQPIEEFSPDWWEEKGKYYDVFMVLVSIYFTTNRLYHSIHTTLKREHHIKRATYFPLLIREGKGLIDLKEFGKLPVLPGNRKALNSGYWRDVDHFYCTVLSELKPILAEIMERKSKHENLWRQTLNSRSVLDFNQFLKTYPYSKYSQQAIKARDEMIDNRLWAEAIRRDSVISYYRYLFQSPLNTHREEAASRINALEENEDLNLQDIKDRQYLEDLLNYRTNFPEGMHREIVRALIDKKLSSEIDRIAYKFMPKEGPNYATDRAYSELDREEIYSMETFLRYSDSIGRKLFAILKDLPMYNYLPGVLLIGFLSSVGYRIIIHGDSQTLLKVFWAIILCFSVIRILRGLYFQLKDRFYLQKAITQLKRLRVLLKVSFISHDKRSTFNILKLLYMIENKIDQIREKTIFHYFFQRKEVEEIKLEQ